MPTKDPITVIGLLATLMLAAGAAMLYLSTGMQADSKPKPEIVFSSPFKEAVKQPATDTAIPAVETVSPQSTVPALSPTSTPALPSLTDAELAELTPAEREQYNNMRQALQQVLQKVDALKQENTRLQQAIEQNSAQNQALDTQIDKMRAAGSTSSSPRQ